MTELAPGYKPVVIGCDGLPEGMEGDMLSSRFVGVDILTDSPDLHAQLLQSDGEDVGIDNSPLATFRYATKIALPLAGHEGMPLRRTGTDHPGEIYASPGLEDFYFQGNDKLGTVASMAYGIRALVNIDHGKLGLHSALIFDQENNTSTLVVGRNHVGKSTVGQAVEDSNDRFIMLADDWSEVELASGELTPVSTIFSPDHPNDRYDLAFTSFGKPFYRKQLGNIAPPTLTLTRIIELHDGKEGAEPNSFILRSLTHIPLLRQPIDEKLFACSCLSQGVTEETIRRKTAAIVDGYKELSSNHETVAVTNNHSRDSLEDVVATVKEIME